VTSTTSPSSRRSDGPGTPAGGRADRADRAARATSCRSPAPANRPAIAAARHASRKVLLRRDQDKLARIRISDEVQRHITRGLLTVEHVGVVGASLGGQIMTLMSLYAEQLEQLT